MDNIIIKVKFTSAIARKMQEEEIELSVPKDFDGAITEIRNYMKEKLGQSILFAVLYEGVNYAIAQKNGAQIKEGATFTITPTVLGG